MSQRIVPNLWFNGNAVEAVDFYSSIFPDSKIIETQNYPSEGLADFQKDLAGKPLVVEFELSGYHFTAINAGDDFAPTPAISFFLNFDPSRDDKAREHLDEMYDKLMDGGKAIMDIGEYPFSKRYGWIQDKYGFSWQLILSDPDGEPRPFIVPSLFFCGPVQNRAHEAVEFYTKVFPNSKVGNLATYGQKFGPVEADSLAYGEFSVNDEWLAVMDSGTENDFTFTEAVSLVVNCNDQAEIDELWSKLSAYPENEQCGWLKDKFGVSWQIVPWNINELVNRPNGFAAMMEMKKLEIDKF